MVVCTSGIDHLCSILCWCVGSDLNFRSARVPWIGTGVGSGFLPRLYKFGIYTITESGISATHLVERRCKIWNECNMTHDEGGHSETNQVSWIELVLTRGARLLNIDTLHFYAGIYRYA